MISDESIRNRIFLMVSGVGVATAFEPVRSVVEFAAVVVTGTFVDVFEGRSKSEPVSTAELELGREK